MRAQLRVSAEKIAAYSTAADGKLGLSLLEHQFDGQSYRSAIAFASSVDGLETLLCKDIELRFADLFGPGNHTQHRIGEVSSNRID